MTIKHCCDCIYWSGEPVGYWESSNVKNFTVKARISCQHPKHLNHPKANTRKACKHFEQKEVTSVIMYGTV